MGYLTVTQTFTQPPRPHNQLLAKIELGHKDAGLTPARVKADSSVASPVMAGPRVKCPGGRLQPAIHNYVACNKESRGCRPEPAAGRLTPGVGMTAAAPFMGQSPGGLVSRQTGEFAPFLFRNRPHAKLGRLARL